MPIIDRRDEMEPWELLEELELRFPEEIKKLEARHPEAWEALVEDDQSAADSEQWEDLLDDIRSLLRV